MNLLTNLMNEHVVFPGTMFIVTTRGFVFEWLKAAGWSPSERGYASLDYTVFAREAVDQPLTDKSMRDAFLNQHGADYRR